MNTRKKSRKNDPGGVTSCRSSDENMPSCAILESMTDGISTVDLNLRINAPFNQNSGVRILNYYTLAINLDKMGGGIYGRIDLLHFL